MFGHISKTIVGHIGNRDPLLSRKCHIYIVQANPISNNHLQARQGGFNDALRRLGPAGQYAVAPRCKVNQRIFIPIGRDD